MKKWEKILRINDVWNDRECSDNNIYILSKNINQRLKMLYPDYEDTDKYGYDLLEVIENFSCVSEKVDPDLPFTPLEEFNDFMTQLYDWADDNSLWVDKY